jgi:hypothetical protein
MAGIGMLGLMVGLVILLVAPGTLAATPNTVLKPPFKTAVVTLTNPQSASGCGAVSLVTGAFFNKTTGVGGFSDNASATGCTTSRNNSALSTGHIQITIPIHVKTTGAQSITVIWTTQAIGSVNLSAGLCRGSKTVASSSCTRSATAFVNGFGFLIDKTTGTQTANTGTWPGNATSVSNVTTCAFTVCTSSATPVTSSALHTGRAGWSWSWTGITLNSTNSYSLELVLFGGAVVTLEVTAGATLKGASANAQFNSSSIHQQENLDSITVT